MHAQDTLRHAVITIDNFKKILEVIGTCWTILAYFNKRVPHSRKRSSATIYLVRFQIARH